MMVLVVISIVFPGGLGAEDVENWYSERDLGRKLARIIVFLAALYAVADDSITGMLIFSDE